jgi:hypothetical protein
MIRYSEVGFGFANSDNFTGTGNETIVVAHYALPVGGSASPPPVEPQPVAEAPKSKPQALNANTVVEPEEEVLVPVVEETPEETPGRRDTLTEDRIKPTIEQ